MALVREADVAVVVGASLNQFTMRFGELFAPGCRVFQVDVAPAATHPHVGGYVRGDAAVVAEAILKAARRTPRPAGGASPSTSRPRDGTSPATGSPRTGGSTRAPRPPASPSCCPRTASSSRTAGTSSAGRTCTGRCPSPDRMVMVGTAFQAIGLGFPSVVGAALARPEATVVLTTGDGGGLMALSDLESAVRVAGGRGIAVVWNDGAYSAEMHLYGRKGLAQRADAHPRRRLRRRGHRARCAGRRRPVGRGPRRADGSGAPARRPNARSCCSTCGSPARWSHRSGRRSPGRAADHATDGHSGEGAHDRRQHGPAGSPRLPGRPGQDRRDPPQLRLARRPARPPARRTRRTSSSRRAPSRPSGGTVERPAGTELLAFEGEIALVIGTTARRVPLDRRLGPRRVGHGGERPRALRPARERQGLQRPVQGRRRVHPRRARPPRRPRGRPGRPAAAHLGQRRAPPGRHDRRAPLPARPARRRPLPAPHARAGRRHPHRHPRRLLGRRPRGRRRGRGRRAGRARGADLGPARHDRHPGRARVRRRARVAARRRRRPARRGVGLARRRRPAPDPASTPELREKLLRAPVAGAQRAAAQARPRRRDDRRRPADAPRRQARRHRAHPAVRAGPRGPVRPPRRRLQRPEARVRHRRRGRGHRHRGARRGRVRHARRHPRPARPRARRRRHRHRRRRPRPRRRRRRRHPRLLGGRAPRRPRPPARAVGRRRRRRVRRDDRRARRRRRRRRRTASSSSRPRSSRRSSTPRSPRRRRTAGSREQVAAGHPVDGLFPMDAQWRARFDAWRASR